MNVVFPDPDGPAIRISLTFLRETISSAMAAIFFFGSELFGFVFGKQWAEAGKIAGILSPMILAIFISSPTSTTYVALRIQRIGLIFGIASIIYRPLALYLGFRFHAFYMGLSVLVILEIIQISLYQGIAWKKMSTDLPLARMPAL